MGEITETAGLVADKNEPVQIVRSRRRSVWWEPIYDERLATEITRGDWKLPENAAHKRVFFGQKFSDEVSERSSRKTFDDARFTKCDFSGPFVQKNGGAVFKDCEFFYCDFGTSTWENFKFTRCKFKGCSFTQSTWLNGEFRDCDWDSISASGNETKLDGVTFSNPEQFIDAMTTNLDADLLFKKGANKKDQILSLCLTRSTVARNIFFNHKTRGDDKSFYRALKKYIVETDRAKREAYFNNFRKGRGLSRVASALKYLICCAESGINACFGYVTNWGG